jgi:lipoprotein-anchoring transpeptidase ErfK/SrfK
VEADLSRQVLALINPGGKVYRVLVTSSGKPSTPTVLGSFRVYSQTPGFNAEGMLDSNYFIGGYAIHGYPDVPPYAASHGCLRIPNSLARFVMNWLDFGDRVDVYG